MGKIKVVIAALLLISTLLGCKHSKNWTCVEGDCNHGYGKRLWNDGGYEKGNFRNGQLDGYGYQFFGKKSNFSGDTYEGEFKNDRYNGKGTYHSIKSGGTYVGYHKDGKQEGKGEISFDSTSKWALQHYEGEWKNGKKNGYGSITYSTKGDTGGNYTGEWKNDKREGKGKCNYLDGTSYEGDWVNDKQEGYGIYIDKKGKHVRVYCHSGNCSPTSVNVTSL